MLWVSTSGHTVINKHNETWAKEEMAREYTGDIQVSDPYMPKYAE